MDLKQLLAAVLTPVVAFAVRWFFAYIGVELDEATFNTIVAAVVAVLLGLFLVDATRAAVKNTRLAKFLPSQ